MCSNTVEEIMKKLIQQIKIYGAPLTRQQKQQQQQQKKKKTFECENKTAATRAKSTHKNYHLFWMLELIKKIKSYHASILIGAHVQLSTNTMLHYQDRKTNS